jgi:aspartate dehydrogenase
MLKIAIIGLGAIGQMVVDALVGDPDAAIVAALVRESSGRAAAALLPAAAVAVSSADELVALSPDLVVECAGHHAVRDFGGAVLAAGSDLLIISTGALAQREVEEELRACATQGGSRILIPAGAIAGLDGLGALKVGGLHEVTYRSTKPPPSWSDTSAEDTVDLRSLTEAALLFDGPARNAAELYPKNANLAMTVALAGLGPDDTRVQLIADPAREDITGEIHAVGAMGALDVIVRGPTAAANHRTSAVTAHSIVNAVRNQVATLVV